MSEIPEIEMTEDKERMRAYKKAYYQKNKERLADYHLAYRKRKAHEAGKEYRTFIVHCDRNCSACRHPDCIEENMTLEELHSSNALDKSIKEERTRYGDAPKPPTKAEAEINRVEYNRTWSRAKNASRQAAKAKERMRNEREG